MKYLLPILLLVSAAKADLREVDRQEISGTSIIRNGGFENQSAYWTASGGTFSINSTAVNVGRGNRSASWDGSSASQTLTTTAVSIPAGLYSRNGVVSCLIKAASGTATHLLQAYDGTNILASSTVSSTTANFSRTSVNFLFPSSGNIQLRLITVASNEPAIYIDDCSVAPADSFNISQISQAQMMGTADHAATANCQWTTAAAAGYQSITDADCPTPTVTGQASAPSTKIPGARFISGLPPGDYLVIAKGSFGKSGTSSLSAYQLYDGTNQYDGQVTSAGANEGEWPNMSFHFSISAATADITYQIRMKDFASTATTWIDARSESFKLSFYRFPSASELAYRPDNTSWFIDATIAGANPSLGSSGQTSYVGIEDAGLTLTAATNSATVQIPCSGTNPPTGTTCAAGNESLGAAFTPPRAGNYQVCVYGAHSTNLSATGTVTAYLQLYETPTNAQTLTQAGGSVTHNQNSGGFANNGFGNPVSNCGTFYFSNNSQRVVRLMYQQSVNATVNSNVILADNAGAGAGDRKLHITVFPILTQFGAPLLSGSVTSNSQGLERWERAKINCDASSSILSQSGSWLSIGNRGTTDCAITITAGIFSAEPVCVFTVEATTVQATSVNMTSATAGTIYGPNADYDGNLICGGPR